jgi:hypothetical protein
MAARKSLAIKTPHLALFVARRNSGKSHLMAHLLYTLAKGQRFRWVLVISPTAFTGAWADIVGKDYVHPEFDSDLLDELMEEQGALREEGVDNPGLVILDDCLGAANFQSDTFTRLAASGRHYGITLWISFQSYYKAPTVVRANSDYLFVMGVQNERVIKGLYDEFGGLGFETQAALRAYTATATRDYGALCVDNLDQKDPVKVVRAPAKLPQFRIKQG